MMLFCYLTKLFFIRYRRLYKQIKGSIRFNAGKAIFGKSSIEEVSVFLVNAYINGNVMLDAVADHLLDQRRGIDRSQHAVGNRGGCY